MRRTLYGVFQDTHQAVADLRAGDTGLDAEISQKLARFETAVEHALASSPDQATVAHPEELVALDALCDLHIAAQSRPQPLREQLRPIVDAWIAYAASTGLTPQELAQAKPDAAEGRIDAWLSSDL
jgi:hypothetical protein